jgi:hypothetical protein
MCCQQVKQGISAHFYLMIQQKGLQHNQKLSTAYSRVQMPYSMHFFYDQIGLYAASLYPPLALIIGLPGQTK